MLEHNPGCLGPLESCNMLGQRWMHEFSLEMGSSAVFKEKGGVSPKMLGVEDFHLK